LFPGGNTAYGFYSFYHHLIPDDSNKIFMIKGGPGVGKASFMKRIGEELRERGLDVEHHHCSSDPRSLDGVALQKEGIALLDGTAPHRVVSTQEIHVNFVGRENHVIVYVIINHKDVLKALTKDSEQIIMVS
jgi:hypothetical protein